MARSKDGEPIAHQNSVWQLQTEMHSDSIYYQTGLRTDIARAQRSADIDLALKNRWAANGFVSRPGNFGPSEEEKE